MMGRRLLILVMAVLGTTLSPSLANDDPRPRLFVLTDISSRRGDGNVRQAHCVRRPVPGGEEPNDLELLWTQGCSYLRSA